MGRSHFSVTNLTTGHVMKRMKLFDTDRIDLVETTVAQGIQLESREDVSAMTTGIYSCNSSL